MPFDFGGAGDGHDAPPPADGLSRILSKSKFGAGRDFEVTDTSGARVLFVDVKVGVTPNAEIRDAQNEVVYAVKGKFLGSPKRMTISAAEGRTSPTWPATGADLKLYQQGDDDGQDD